MSWEHIAYAAFAAAAVLAAALVARSRRIEQERSRARRAESVLQDAPLGVLRWTGERWTANRAAASLLSLKDSAQLTSPGDLVAALPRASAEAFGDALEQFVSRGSVFELTLETAERNSLVLSATCDGDNRTVWIRDDTAAAWLADSFTELEGEVTFLRGLLNMVPIPIWWRDADTLEIMGRNAAYDAITGPGVDGAVPELSSGQQAHTLAKLAMRTGSAQSESRHVVHGGTRHALSITEGPVPGRPDVIGGIAQDLTALEELQVNLAEHIAVQDQLLEKLTSAIAIFGPDKRLKFFNTPYAHMWNVPEKILDDQPTMSALLENLRERQQLPELSDFPAFKRSMDQLFTSLIDPVEELMHLPDGRTIRCVTAPHPLGGLIFQYEDVTDRLALESSHNTLTAVQKSTLDSLLEGVCVFGRDGRMKLFNNVYAGMFGFDPEWLAAGPHITDVIDAGTDLFNYTGDWDTLRDRVIRSVSDPKAKSGEMYLTDGRVVEYAYIPLPDGQCLVLYLDITDTTQVEQALRERNKALENADLLKSQFISNVSYELRTPLNAILGFSELLRIGTADTLSERQAVYVDGIKSAGTTLSDLIEDMLDLAAVQAGFIELVEEDVDLAALMNTVADGCVPDDAEARDRVSRVEISGPPPTQKVRVDSIRLERSLGKLLSAAVNTTPTEKSVRIVWSPEQATDGTVAFRMETDTTGRTGMTWPDLVLGPSTDRPGASAMIDGSPKAVTADLAVRLARSLIYAQKGELERDKNPEALVCRLPTVV